MNKWELERQKFAECFLRTVRGALPLTLTNSLAKECGITVYGNTKKYTTIDGVRYAVPDDVTLLDSVTANESGFNLDFGITPKLNTKARVVFTPLAANNSGYFGARKDTDSVRFCITTFTQGSLFAFALTRTTWSNNKTSLSVGTRYDCTAYNGKQIINGVEYNETVLSNLGSTNATFKICAPDNNGAPATSAILHARYELVYIWEGETPVLLAHPAIRNNVVGYYDFVSKSFIAPTSGTLTAGKMTRTENFHTDIPSDLYQEVEYLGLQGDECINTGIVPAGKKIGAIVDFQFTDISRTTGGIFGSNKIDGTDNCQFTIYTSKWRTKINNFAHYGANCDTDRHTVRFNMPDGTKLDNTVITNTQYTIASGNNVSLLLGACSYNGSPISTNIKYTLIGKLYPSKIYVDGVLARDYVSVKRLSDDQYGMYDRVTSTFKPNEGTGAFTGGDARQIEVPICEYSFVGDAYGNMYDVPLRMGNQGVVDLGSLDWTKYTQSGGNAFFTNLTGKTNGERNLYSSDYDIVPSPGHSADLLDGEAIGGNTSNRIYIRDDRFTDAASFKAAMSGKYLYYQRTTDAVWNPPALRHLASSRKLGKIGTYIDTASIKDGVRTSVFWMGHKVFDGTEDWALWSNCFYIAISDLIRTTANVLGGYCTHFKYIGFIINNPPSGDLYYGYHRVAGQENNGNVSFKHSAITTVEDWKAYLAKQYAAGHPVEVWYPLATAVTETATETNVTLPENDVTMDAECSVKPSEAAVTFNSRSNY